MVDSNTLLGILVILVILYFLWRTFRGGDDPPIDNKRRAFSNMEKFRVAEKNVLKYGKLKCERAFCNRMDLDLDHIKPLARGGHNGISNLQLLCSKHNKRKGARYSG